METAFGLPRGLFSKVWWFIWKPQLRVRVCWIGGKHSVLFFMHIIQLCGIEKSIKCIHEETPAHRWLLMHVHVVIFLDIAVWFRALRFTRNTRCSLYTLEWTNKRANDWRLVWVSSASRSVDLDFLDESTEMVIVGHERDHITGLYGLLWTTNLFFFLPENVKTQQQSSERGTLLSLRLFFFFNCSI